MRASWTLTPTRTEASERGAHLAHSQRGAVVLAVRDDEDDAVDGEIGVGELLRVVGDGGDGILRGIVERGGGADA